jgi:hypothetical protein
MEIVVDAYDAHERGMGWYYYLEDRLRTPFTARCTHSRRSSPLCVGDRVVVSGMAEVEVCVSDMVVTIRHEGRRWAVPLSQLKAEPGTEARTKQAVEDWRYWVARGYEF